MDILKNLNNSKYFAGIMILVLNLGSKFVAMELSDSQEKFMSNIIIRRFVVFTMIFIATKDLLVSFVLTGVFILLVSGLFNENSNYCIITKPVQKQITKEQAHEAQKILKLYEIQKKSVNII